MAETKLWRQVGAVFNASFMPIRRGLQLLADIQKRERIRLAAEMAQTRELMPLLMKQRNGYHWTEDDRKSIKNDLAALKHISPYLILFLAPGGFLTIPILAWWLDRRRLKRDEQAKSADQAAQDK